MSCYIRHLSDLFHETGVEFNKENRKLADGHIRALVGLGASPCNEVWHVVKPMLADIDARAGLVRHLRKEMGSG